MTDARAAAKSLVEGLLGSGVLAGIHRRDGGYLVLAYHNVVPGPGAQVGDRSLHIGFDLFRRHLDLLGDRVSSLDDVLAGTAPARSIAITFDDAYASAMSLALPELGRRSLPATIFIAPGLLGQGVPWWDAIASEPSGLSNESRGVALDELAGRTASVISWARSRSMRLLSDPLCSILNIEDLDLLRSTPRITVAAHTWSHLNMLRVTPDELGIELARTLSWLAEHFPMQHRSWLAWPYGLYSEETVKSASGQGHSATFAIRGGWFSTAGADGAFPRLNVPAGLSVSGLAARLNGFLIR